MENVIGKAITAAIVSAGSAIIISFIMAIPVQLLWNYVGVEFFQFQPISYWHSWCLYYLCRILFSK